ncbi:MAG: hypothetical protein NZ455_00300 [Bacteroidia bacterium]|nr:hypothetical protein [Bacteroidia bacterium]
MFFWACPFASLGSACYGLRFASVLCCASHRANARPPHASRSSILTFYLFYTRFCLTFFNIDYQLLTR